MRRAAARFAAPVAFLAAATIAVLLVRSALSSETTPVTTTTAPATQPAATTGGTDTGGTTATTGGQERFYEIESGDTLETIAAEHGTTVERLLVLNPDIDPVALTIGQRIRVE